MARHFSSRTERGGRRTAGMAHAGAFVSVRSGGRNVKQSKLLTGNELSELRTLVFALTEL